MTSIRKSVSLDPWPWDLDSPLSDDPSGEHYDFNSFINDEVIHGKVFGMMSIDESIFRIH